MSLLIALVLGLGIGAAGQFVMRKEPDALLMSVLSGVVGSLLGLTGYAVLDFNQATAALFSLPALLFCAVGALIAVLIFSGLYKLTEGKE
jgi:uncharacterized membrane protein YeaQ/YmgE (transglycosylase-associated protein family)